MRNKSLQNALLGNAAFSLISALSLNFASDTLATIMGLFDDYWLRWVGLGLLVFVVFIGIIIRMGMPIFGVNTIIIQDLIWVIASTLVILINPWSISHTGLLLIALVAIMVGFFAWLQYKYSRTGIVKN